MANQLKMDKVQAIFTLHEVGWSNPRRALRQVLARHASDQVADLPVPEWSSQPTGSRFPSPIETKALSMPAGHRIRLNDDQRSTPVGPESR